VPDSSCSPDNPHPVTYTLDNTNDRTINHANVFSREKLDIGTRFFLEYLPRPREIIDQGYHNPAIGQSAVYGQVTAFP